MGKTKFILITLILTQSFLISSAAQTSYKIYPGDKIAIKVFDNEDLVMELNVPQDGKITFPLIGELVLIGKTTTKLEEELEKRLGEDYLVDPDIRVVITDYSKKYLYILGMVKIPQSYEIPHERTVTLLQAISMAGGFTPDAAKDKIKIFRRKSLETDERIVLEVNAINIMEESKVEQDIVIQHEDIIIVPEMKKIYILGNVNNPGDYSMPSDKKLTLTQAITMAGGFNKVAREAKTKVLRKSKDGKQDTIVIDVSEIIDKGKLDKDIILEPGDIIFIPESFF